MIHYITLNNGVKMPQIGLGTYRHFLPQLEKTVALAWELGYRNIDTSWDYKNERDLATAFKSCRIPREEIFVTTKLDADPLYWAGWHQGKRKILNLLRRRTIKQAIEISFKNLGFEYIDLMLVHWPWPQFRAMYDALADYMQQGRIRAIGVSSFQIPHLQALAQSSDIVPAVNQFEISPLNHQQGLIDYCQSKNIVVEAMSTFSHFRSRESRAEILANKTIEEIAAKHGKTSAQTVLRWLVQQGIIIIPSSKSPVHLRENIELWDFSLDKKEMESINSLDRGKWLNYDSTETLKWL